MPATTPRDIVTKALQKLVILAEGEVPTAQQMNDGFYSLNAMLDSWSGRSLLTTAQVQESFALTAAKGVYTIGPVGCDVTSAKPFEIISGFVRDANNADFDLQVVGRETYDSYAGKTIVGEVSRPQALFYDPGVTQQTVQKGTILLYPYPDTSSTYTLFIDSEKAFTEFATLSDTVTFPPVYLRSMIYNLACELAPEYGKAIHPEVYEVAHESMRIIENINSRNKRFLASVDFSGKTRAFNIWSGMFE
jgi:hypothetical protein